MKLAAIKIAMPHGYLGQTHKSYHRQILLLKQNKILLFAISKETWKVHDERWKLNLHIKCGNVGVNVLKRCFSHGSLFSIQVQWSLYFTTLYFKTSLDYKTAWFGPKGKFFVLNDLYFKTTCNIRPLFLGPMGGLIIEGSVFTEAPSDGPSKK